jgi:protein O-GlcNAc transferase
VLLPPKVPGAPDNDPAFQAALFAHQNGRLAEAQSLYEGVIQRNKKHFPALVMLSALKTQKADYSGAEQLIRIALKLQPGDVRALMQHAQIQLAQERHDEAFAAFGEALARNSAIPEAHANRGAILMLRKRYGEALDCFDAALRLRPDFAPALCNRGNALQELNRLSEALAAYDAALRLQATDAEFLASRANCLFRMRRHDEALADLDAALTLQPQNPEFLYNEGNVLSHLKKFEEAFLVYDAAYRVRPDLDYLAGDRLLSKLNLCDWSNLDGEAADIISGVEEGRAVARPFVMLALPSSRTQQLRCAQQFMQREFPPQSPSAWPDRQHRDRIRVAYVSADFHTHATAHLISGFFEVHDRTRFAVTAISFGPDDCSAERKRIVAGVENFFDVARKSDDEIVQLIREQQIDILVDLKGFTQDARPRIFARRPAPIQVNYLGYPGTMGADYFDYIVADETVIPSMHFNDYSERVVGLPDSYQVNDSLRRIADRPPSKSECSLPETGFVFCSFNNSFKITPDIFDIWMRLLLGAEHSVLWLIEGAAATRRNLRQEAEKRGVSAERLIFAPRMPLADHLARHKNADLFLDTLPYNAHTTASDALWSGLPVLTCVGETFAGRVAASLLRAVGLDELVTSTLADYEALASRLARDPASVANLKARLRSSGRTGPLFDTKAFARHLERAYETMCELNQSGRSPQPFSVPRLP